VSADYTELIVWQKSMDLVLLVDRCTRAFPRDAAFCLTTQMGRAAISVASKIAEGKGRQSIKELTQFLFVARGSLPEIETQSMLAQKLGYLKEQDSSDLKAGASEVGRLLNGMIAHFKARQHQTARLTPETGHLPPET
jgi:four helix bundle protein